MTIQALILLLGINFIIPERPQSFMEWTLDPIHGYMEEVRMASECGKHTLDELDWGSSAGGLKVKALGRTPRDAGLNPARRYLFVFI